MNIAFTFSFRLVKNYIYKHTYRHIGKLDLLFWDLIRTGLSREIKKTSNKMVQDGYCLLRNIRNIK